MMIRSIFFWSLLFLISLGSNAQSSYIEENPYRADTLNRSRMWSVIGLESGLAGSSATGLYLLWYKGYEQSGFHFLNDNPGWLQIDKIGHAYSAYHISWFCYNMNRWSGMKRNKSMLIGVGIAYGFQTAIEVMDGFSAGWGASFGDMAANTLGAGLFVAQEYAWNEQRILMKYSFTPKDYSGFDENVQRRAEKLFGNNLAQNILKDYNGQNHWLSINPVSFGIGNTWIPNWLNLAFGYSGEQMLGANWNVWFEDDICYRDYEHIPRLRQYYFSLDVDFTRINSRKKWVRAIAPYLSLVKIPFPAISLDSRGQFNFHPLFF